MKYSFDLGQTNLKQNETKQTKQIGRIYLRRGIICLRRSMCPRKINTTTHKTDTERMKVSRERLSTAPSAHIELAGKYLKENWLQKLVSVFQQSIFQERQQTVFFKQTALVKRKCNEIKFFSRGLDVAVTFVWFMGLAFFTHYSSGDESCVYFMRRSGFDNASDACFSVFILMNNAS